MACPLQCDFCCYGCHPQRTEKMPLELAFRLIKEAAELGKFSSIGFTGGEPMLFLDELLQIGRRLKGYGLPFTIATAAHWAKSEKRAHEILEELAKVGLCRLNVSYDPSHAKFIPKKSILSAITASSHLESLHTSLAPSTRPSSQWKTTFQRHLILPRSLSLPNMFPALGVPLRET